MSSTKQNDLQSFGELEKSLYGGLESYSYFQRDIKKCLPFTQIATELTKSNGTPNFGYTWSVVVNNSDGDYLSNCWIVLELPEVPINPDNTFGENGVLRWTENLMHNIIEECSVTFNETCISKIDNFALDFLSEFAIEENKYQGYMKSIGNIPELVYPSKLLKSKKIYLPLPLFFTKDTGNAIPLSALPHTEIRINFKFRNWENLLIFENNTLVIPKICIPIVGKDIDKQPIIKSAKLYGTFITVSDEERYKIGIKHKLMMIEQIQTSPRQMVNKDNYSKIDLLFKHSVKTIYFAVRNTTFKNVWSNYNYDHDKITGNLFRKNTNHNIIKNASILYGDKERVIEMPDDYFHYVNPWYHGTRMPSKDGVYMYSFSLDQNSSDPSGGVNLSKIDNPSLKITLTEESIQSSDNFELVVVAVSNNIIRISEGLVTFPVI